MPDPVTGHIVSGSALTDNSGNEVRINGLF